MTASVSFLVISVVLVAQCSAAPWNDENNLEENNLEWQCKTLCRRSNGRPIFKPESSVCFCEVNTGDDTNVDWKRIKKNAKYLGLTVELLDAKTKVKRNTPEDNTVADVDEPKPIVKQPLHDRIQTLLAKKKSPTLALIPPTLESSPKTESQIAPAVAKKNQHPIVGNPIKTNADAIRARAETRKELLRQKIRDRIVALRQRSFLEPSPKRSLQKLENDPLVQPKHTN